VRSGAAAAAARRELSSRVGRKVERNNVQITEHFCIVLIMFLLVIDFILSMYCVMSAGRGTLSLLPLCVLLILFNENEEEG
jgi:hypothetical protein